MRLLSRAVLEFVPPFATGSIPDTSPVASATGELVKTPPADECTMPKPINVVIEPAGVIERGAVAAVASFNVKLPVALMPSLQSRAVPPASAAVATRCKLEGPR